MRPVIEIQSVSKRYYISPDGSQVVGNNNFVDAMAGLGNLIFKRLSGHTKAPTEVWALRDVSFNLEQGQTIGIVGVNGAGKSTLLKILSRITLPTQGRVILRGRVNSLLEVGTGFHSELTGRENIFLNGAMLGMKSVDIRQKLDAIIDFADIGQYIDVPVKRYSSGMHMRLAFAVASHLEPDILIVDEALAVGDVAFQRKCLERMAALAQTATAQIIVSHDLAAIRRAAHRVIWMDGGRLRGDGEVRKVLENFQSLCG